MSVIRPIALYLPQFHPIPENDNWWEKGFTEWTNVAKAKPLFKGHWQPRLPADLGFYDLRVPETREVQALLANQHGIYGFCYWHYWFAGKRLLEKPFNEVVRSKRPDFPFCLAWANQTWEGKWHGVSNNKVLIEQTYPGIKDHEDHFYALLDAFKDERYITVNGKRIFFIFQPIDFPNPKAFIDLWQGLAIKEGLKGFHFVGMHMDAEWPYATYGYNAIVQKWLNMEKLKNSNFLQSKKNNLFNLFKKKKIEKGEPLVISYQEYVEQYPEHPVGAHEYPVVYADWDSTPRAGHNGWLFEGTSPELFGELCQRAFIETGNKPVDEKFVLVKSWNEWAEGNYLEPDSKYGLKYLNQFKQAIEAFKQK